MDDKLKAPRTYFGLITDLLGLGLAFWVVDLGESPVSPYIALAVAVLAGFWPAYRGVRVDVRTLLLGLGRRVGIGAIVLIGAVLFRFNSGGEKQLVGIWLGLGTVVDLFRYFVNRFSPGKSIFGIFLVWIQTATRANEGVADAIVMGVALTIAERLWPQCWPSRGFIVGSWLIWSVLAIAAAWLRKPANYLTSFAVRFGLAITALGAGLAISGLGMQWGHAAFALFCLCLFI